MVSCAWLRGWECTVSKPACGALQVRRGDRLKARKSAAKRQCAVEQAVVRQMNMQKQLQSQLQVRAPAVVLSILHSSHISLVSCRARRMAEKDDDLDTACLTNRGPA